MTFCRTVETKYGPMMVNEHDRYMAQSLIAYGVYSPGELRFYEQLLTEGCVVIEAGASFGVNTVPLAKIVGPRGRVYSFEPQRLFYQMLCGNAALNNLTNVHAFNVALGSTPGTIPVAVLDVEHFNNFGGLDLRREVPEGTDREMVPVMRLDDIIPEGQPVHLLQLDAEGMEPDILAGAQRVISESRPAIYVEADRPDVIPVLELWMKDNNYLHVPHFPLLFEPDNWKGNPENVFGADVASKNWMCFAAEKVETEPATPELADAAV